MRRPNHGEQQHFPQPKQVKMPAPMLPTHKATGDAIKSSSVKPNPSAIGSPLKGSAKY